MDAEEKKEEKVEGQLDAGTPPAAEQPAQKGEQEKAAQASEEAKIAAFQKAAESERHKRQKAVEEAAYWRGQAEAKAKEIEPKPEDLDLEFMANPSKSVQNAVAQARWETKVEITTEIERDKHADYDEKESIFGQQRRLNPGIANDPKFQRNPAKFAYEWASNFLNPKGADDSTEALKKRVDELTKKIAELTSGTAGIPQTQAGARSVSGETAPDASEDWLAEATVKKGGKRPF